MFYLSKNKCENIFTSSQAQIIPSLNKTVTLFQNTWHFHWILQDRNYFWGLLWLRSPAKDVVTSKMNNFDIHQNWKFENWDPIYEGGLKSERELAPLVRIKVIFSK